MWIASRFYGKKLKVVPEPVMGAGNWLLESQLIPVISQYIFASILGYLEKYVRTLEEKGKNDTLCTVYAGINRKPVDDPDMVQFFKFKYWM